MVACKAERRSNAAFIIGRAPSKSTSVVLSRGLEDELQGVVEKKLAVKAAPIPPGTEIQR